MAIADPSTLTASTIRIPTRSVGGAGQLEEPLCHFVPRGVIHAGVIANHAEDLSTLHATLTGLPVRIGALVQLRAIKHDNFSNRILDITTNPSYTGVITAVSVRLDRPSYAGAITAVLVTLHWPPYAGIITAVSVEHCTSHLMLVLDLTPWLIQR
ncbi:hypothetical protein JB92DRAFT_2833556 [Gautieria morchelliformis]|nr:hypothetical protein JB92DRAFT_2833556 [Gautieria morchelliformis]